MSIGRTVYRRKGHGAIKRDEASVMRLGEGKQVRIRHLTRRVQPRPVHDSCVKQADVAGPELVLSIGGGACEQADRFRGRDRARVSRLAHHAHEPVLGERA
jgi:hypothetical protein